MTRDIILMPFNYVELTDAFKNFSIKYFETGLLLSRVLQSNMSKSSDTAPQEAYICDSVFRVSIAQSPLNAGPPRVAPLLEWTSPISLAASGI